MRRWQRLKYVHLRLVTFDWQVLTNDFQQSAYKRICCMFRGTISEDWSRFVLITGRTKKGHFWMQRIAETVGEFLEGDWGRSQLITGGNIGGHYYIMKAFNAGEPIGAHFYLINLKIAHICILLIRTCSAFGPFHCGKTKAMFSAIWNLLANDQLSEKTYSSWKQPAIRPINYCQVN